LHGYLEKSNPWPKSIVSAQENNQKERQGLKSKKEEISQGDTIKEAKRSNPNI